MSTKVRVLYLKKFNKQIGIAQALKKKYTFSLAANFCFSHAFKNISGNTEEGMQECYHTTHNHRKLL